MKILSRSVLFCISIMMLISWGYEGHQTIALIAENHLTPVAKNAVQILLRDQKMTDVASWADDVRSDPEWKYTAPWHFVNVADGLNEAPFKDAVEQQSNPNLYTAILKCETDLRGCQRYTGAKDDCAQVPDPPGRRRAPTHAYQPRDR